MGSRGDSVVVGMSGGVDSAVAASLLKDEGWLVVGVTMRHWMDPTGDPTRGGCCSLASVQEARRTCAELGIPHYTVDLQSEFEEKVVLPFVEEYTRGRTPNPCTWCNVLVRFEQLVAFARRIGASRWATGHYARVRCNEASERYELLRGRCAEKDQSYMLYRLTQEQLAGCLFPLGEMPSKAATRAIAIEKGLTVAARRESQDICFVSGGDYRAFVRERSRVGIRPGPIVDGQGREIGRHPGVAFFTIGQRRGLPAYSGGPLYVVRLDADRGIVHVGPEKLLYSDTVIVEKTTWTSIAPPAGTLAVTARIRYNAPAASATVEPQGERVVCRFCQPQRAVTPGQAIVFYDGDKVLGGGVIHTAVMSGEGDER